MNTIEKWMHFPFLFIKKALYQLHSPIYHSHTVRHNIVNRWDTLQDQSIDAMVRPLWTHAKTVHWILTVRVWIAVRFGSSVWRLSCGESKTDANQNGWQRQDDCGDDVDISCLHVAGDVADVRMTSTTLIGEYTERKTIQKFSCKKRLSWLFLNRSPLAAG
jgi:hypothetical protein